MHNFALGAAAPILFALTAVAQTAAKPAPLPPAPQAATSTNKPGEPPPPAHPLTVAQAHELMQLTGTDRVKARLVDQGAAAAQRFPPFIPADVKEDIHSSLEKLDVDAQVLAIYQRYLSTEAAAKAINFYKTPAGKELLDTTPVIMGEIQQTAAKDGQQTFQAVIERHRAEIEAAQKTYQAEHSSPAPTLGPGAGSPSTPKTAPAPTPQPH